MNSLFFILALTFLDRLRGSGWVPKGIAQVVYGVTLACFIYPHGWFILFFTLCFLIGVSPGWGQPLGAYIARTRPDVFKAESWQFNDRLKKDALLSICYRGLLWAAPLIALNLWFKPYAAIAGLAVLFSFPLAAFCARQLLPHTIRAWELHEYIRGFLIGVFTLIFKGVLL